MFGASNILVFCFGIFQNHEIGIGLSKSDFEEAIGHCILDTLDKIGLSKFKSDKATIKVFVIYLIRDKGHYQLPSCQINGESTAIRQWGNSFTGI